MWDRLGSVVAFVLFGSVLAGAFVPQPGAAQTTAALTFGPLQAPNPFIVDGGHALSVTVRNGGSVPVSGAVTFYHSSVMGANQIGQPTFSANGGQTVTVTQPWNGRPTPENPLLGDHPLFAVLSVNAPFAAPDDNQRTVTTFFAHFRPQVEPQAPTQTTLQPGGFGEQLILVRNLGNVMDNYTLTLGTATAGWTFEIVPVLADNVRPGFARTVTLSVQAPTSGAAGGQGSVQIQARSAALSTAQHSAPSAAFSVATTNAFSVTVNPTTLALDPGAPMTATGRVTNTGNAPASYSFSVTLPAGFPAVALSQTSATIEPGSSADVVLTASTAPATPAGLYAIAFTAQNTETSAVQTSTLSVTVRQRYGLQLSFPDDEITTKTLSPNAAGTFRVTVVNTGNGPDRFVLNALDLPTGWTFVRVSPAATHAVAGGSDATATTSVHVVQAAPPGTYNFRIEAASDGQPTNRMTVNVRVIVPAIPLARIVVAQPTLPMDPGGDATFPVAVHNDGNVDDTFTFAAPTRVESSPTTGWSATWQPASLTVAKGATGQVSLRVTHADPTSLSKTSFAKFRLTAQTSQGQTSAPLEVIAQTSMPDLSVTGIEILDPPYKTAPTRIKIFVENIGTRSTTVPTQLVLELFKGADPALSEPVVFEVPALDWHVEENKVNFTFTWTPTDPGEHLVRATVDPHGLVEEKFDETTPGQNNNQAEDATFVRTFSLVVTAVSGRTTVPGARLIFDGTSSFRIQNTGNRPETLTLTVTSPNGWPTAVSPAEITVADGAFANIAVTLDVPANPGLSEGTLRLTAAGDGPGTFSGTVPIRIEDRAAPVIQSVSTNPTVIPPGGSFQILATVSDAIGVASVKAYVTSTTGLQTALPLTGSGGQWSATTSLANPGTYTIIVEAADTAQPANMASNQNAPASIRVVGNGVPTIEVVDAPTNVVRGASTLTFQVRDARGLQRVWFEAYTLNETAFARLAPDVGTNRTIDLDAALGIPQVLNRVLPLGNPYEVPLHGLPEGPVAVVLAATNAFGNTNATLVMVRLDNTAPAIKTVDANWMDGRLEIVVAVEEASDLGVVEIAATGPENAPTRVPMVSQGNGTFRAQLEPELATRPWHIVVWDNAGNSELFVGSPSAGEDASPLTATHGSTPGFVLWAFLAAACVATWRKRRIC